VACLNDNVIAAYFDFKLSVDATYQLFQHVDSCMDCARLLAESAGLPSTLDSRGATGASPAVAVELGRYRIDRIIGMGGMGVVYAAHDDQLDRSVAIKLLRSDPRIDPKTLHARLMHEAQAMAKLSHPNVINVYEVSTVDEQVFVVMELVVGSTLGAWLRAEPRSWRDIVDVFAGAGAGLEAAHAAGIVHRDFKPDNVLVSRTGRVCVSDFGLARWIETSPQLAASPAGSLDASATRTGVLVGTPAYMAPEQIRGEPVNQASDVFSFSVALYEAVCGTRPFAGTTLDDVCAAIDTRRFEKPVRFVPAWLRRTIMRGLDPRAAARPPMTELIAAIRCDPRARRRRWLLGVCIAAVVVGVAVATRGGDSAPELCRGAERRLAGVWDDARRAQLASSFAAANRPYLADSSRIVAEILDDRAHAWVAERTDACEATRVRGEQSDALLDRRIACLDDRLRDTRAYVDVVTGANASVLERATSAASSLEPIERCHDPGPDQPAPPSNPGLRAALEQVRARVATAEQQRQTAQYSDAMATASDAIMQARRLGDLATLAGALAVAGHTAEQRAEFEDARRFLGEAELAAQQAHDDRVATRVDIELAAVEVNQERPREATPWLQLADGVLRRIGGDDKLEGARLLLHAQVVQAAGDLPAAEADDRAAVALAERDHSVAGRGAVGVARANLGNVLRFEHRDTEAVATLRQSLAETREALGARHPVVARVLEALAVAVGAELGGADSPAANEAMLPMFREQLALFEQAYGESHPRVGNVLFNIGDVLAHLHRDAEAILAFERSVAIYRRFADPTSNDLNQPLAELGETYVRVGRFADAVAPLEASLPVDTGDDARKRLSLAEALWESHGDRRRAVVLGRDARRLADKAPALAALRAEADDWLRAHQL
jgi:serine/threonine protein kinase